MSNEISTFIILIIALLASIIPGILKIYAERQNRKIDRRLERDIRIAEINRFIDSWERMYDGADPKLIGMFLPSRKSKNSTKTFVGIGDDGEMMFKESNGTQSFNGLYDSDHSDECNRSNCNDHN